MYSDRINPLPGEAAQKLLSHSIKFAVQRSPQCKPTQQHVLSHSSRINLYLITECDLMLDRENAEPSLHQQTVKKTSSSEECALPTLVWADWSLRWLSSSSACEHKQKVLSDFWGKLTKKRTFTKLKVKHLLKFVYVPKIAPTKFCSVTGSP